MAGSFDGNLSDPQRMYAPYGGGSSGASPFASVAEGLTGVAGAVMERQGQTARAEQGNGLVGQINDLVTQGAHSGPPALVGQDPPDSATAAGANSTTGQSLNSDLSRITQASAQGAMSEQEKLIRVNTMVQNAVNKDPLHADYYRELAKSTLGVTPTAELFKLQNDSADFERNLSQSVYKDNVTASAQAGITILKPDGTPDLQSMAASGAKLLQSEKDTELTLKAAELAKAQAGAKLSHEDQVSMDTNTAMAGLNPMLNQVHDSMLNNLPALVAKYGPLGRDAAGQQLSVDLNNNQAQVLNYVDGFSIKNNLSPDATAKVKEYVKSMFDDYRTLFGDPKQPLDQLSANAKTLKNAQNVGQLDFRTAMPAAAKIKDAVGDPGIAAFFSQNAVLDPNVASTLQNEAHGYINGKPTATDVANAAASAFKGDYDVSKEQRPAWQSAVTTGIVRTVNSLAQTPDKLSPEQQTAFGHSMVQISNVALNDKGPTNLRAAAGILTAPGVMRTFTSFAKNPDNADHVPLVAAGMSSVLYQHVVADRRTLAQGVSTTVQVPRALMDSVPTNYSPNGLGPQTQTVQVHGGSVYNPSSGQVEFQMTATDEHGKPINLNPQQSQAAMSAMTDYRGAVAQTNRSLDGLSVLKDYSKDGSENLKPLEMKGITVQSAGIPVKPGMHIPVPASMSQTANPPPSTTGSSYIDGVHQLEGGNEGQKNPRSSATGTGQFLDKTWLQVSKQAFPGEVKDMSDSQILALRNNQNFADRMIDTYKMQNASRLHAAGIDNPDDTDLYMAHHFGPEGAIKIMNAPLRTPIESILPPEVMKANPDLKGMTPLKLYQKYSQAFGGAPGG